MPQFFLFSLSYIFNIIATTFKKPFLSYSYLSLNYVLYLPSLWKPLFLISSERQNTIYIHPEKAISHISQCPDGIQPDGLNTRIITQREKAATYLL